MIRRLILLQARCALTTNGHLVHISSDDKNELLENMLEKQYPNIGNVII